MSGLMGCGSHSCVIAPPAHEGHSGSCRCLVSDYRGQSLIKRLKAQIEEHQQYNDILEAKLKKLDTHVDRQIRAMGVYENALKLCETHAHEDQAFVAIIQNRRAYADKALRGAD